MEDANQLSKEDASKEVNETFYRSMIRKLQYIFHSWSYIVHEFGIIARFLSNPTKSHMTIVKKIFGYLKGIEDLGLWYDRQRNFSLDVFIDVDSNRNFDDRKVTIGGAFFLGERLV